MEPHAMNIILNLYKYMKEGKKGRFFPNLTFLLIEV